MCVTLFFTITTSELFIPEKIGFSMGFIVNSKSSSRAAVMSEQDFLIKNSTCLSHVRSHGIFFIGRIYCVALFIHLFFLLQAFFTSGAMMNVLETFCIYHITAPGQEAGAKDLPEGYVYPTMDELADQVNFNH